MDHDGCAKPDLRHNFEDEDMNYVLYLSPSDRQLWCKTAEGWELASGEPDGPVWVVADLAEESLTESKTPRLFGRDRTSFVERQVATRYPDTPYRGSMLNLRPDDLIGRLIPTQYVFFGIDAAERLNSELDAIKAPIAGVWPVSLLMGGLARDRSLYPDLFVVLPGKETLRIVYLKNRTPVLTRLTMTPNESGAQVEELVRTLRHLENTQVVPRDRKANPVLLLGSSEGFVERLDAARMRLVDLPRREKQPVADWRHPLFDLVLKSPPGQVAPMARRVSYLSTRLSTLARNLAFLIVIAGLGAASSNLFSIYRMIEQRVMSSGMIEDLDQDISDLDANIARFGVAPDTVRRAITLYEDEISEVPGMESHLQMLSQVLSKDPNLRLRDLQWRLLPPGADPCLTTAAAIDAVAGADAKPPGSDQRRVELSFDLAVPETYGPRDRAQILRTISGDLSAIPESKIWQDANKELASGSLRGGTVLSTAAKLSWCLTLPGKVVASPPGDGGPRK
jgi:hypothetical protein